MATIIASNPHARRKLDPGAVIAFLPPRVFTVAIACAWMRPAASFPNDPRSRYGMRPPPPLGQETPGE